MMKRLGLIDDALLRFETRRQSFNIGVLMLLEPPAGSGKDFGKFLAARLREYTRTAHPFNQCLVNHRGLHYWEEDKQFDLDQHFVHLLLPEPGRGRELLAMVSRVHCMPLDRAYPLWRMYLIENLEDDRIAVYLKMHHAMVDGVAGMRLLVKSMSTSVEESEKMPPPWGINLDRSGTAEPLPVPLSATSGISAMRSLAREGIGSSLGSMVTVFRELRRTLQDYREKNPDLAIGGVAPRCLFNDKVSGSRRFAAQSYPMASIKAVAKAYDCTSNDVILAMCSSALRRYLAERDNLPQKEPLLASVPVSVRGRGQRGDIGNEIAFTTTHLATHIDDPVERLIAIKNCMDYNKERIKSVSPGQLMTHNLLTYLPGLAGSLLKLKPERALANVVISHVPGPRRTLYWQGCEVTGIYPVSMVLDGMALNITVVSRKDYADFGVIACRKTVTHMQRLLDYLAEGLAELEGTLAPVKPKRKKPVRKAVKPKPIAKTGKKRAAR